MINKAVQFAVTSCALVAFALSLSASHANAQAKDKKNKAYTYATKGLLEFQSTVEPGKVERWKLLLDQSNLGGKELEMVELTLPAGEVVGAHRHGSVEIFYVLSGTLGHEVNGEMHMLTPGMVGVVRPEDSVRHVEKGRRQAAGDLGTSGGSKEILRSRKDHADRAEVGGNGAAPRSFAGSA